MEFKEYEAIVKDRVLDIDSDFDRLPPDEQTRIYQIAAKEVAMDMEADRGEDK